MHTLAHTLSTDSHMHCTHSCYTQHTVHTHTAHRVITRTHGDSHTHCHTLTQAHTLHGLGERTLTHVTHPHPAHTCTLETERDTSHIHDTLSESHTHLYWRAVLSLTHSHRFRYTLHTHTAVGDTVTYTAYTHRCHWLYTVTLCGAARHCLVHRCHWPTPSDTHTLGQLDTA